MTVRQRQQAVRARTLIDDAVSIALVLLSPVAVVVVCVVGGWWVGGR